MDDTIDGVGEDSGEATSASGKSFVNIGTIDSVDGRPALPFSVAALVVSFVLLYFTPILDLFLGFGNPLFEIDSATRLIVSAFLSF